MSVDVEDYFQVEALKPYIPRRDWDSLPGRLPFNVDRILELFDAAGVHATFFTLGWIAERYPEVLRRIAARGHEVASHGYDHERASGQNRDTFREDVMRAKSLLEDITGNAVLGYRAPSYSIGASNLWALDVLAKAGYRYSSSIYPVRHDLYGMPDAPRFPFRAGRDGILEIPISTVRLFGHNLPCGGGGYFRLLPYRVSRWALGRINRRDRQPAIFYFHPWEIDPDQPRIPGVDWRSRFRHYLNLERMSGRLQQLLRDFRWDRVDRVFLADSAEPDVKAAPGG
ncbi:MAG: XrtA system polysaccharide deacetylase [Gammaproteobacteria bacterium]